VRDNFNTGTSKKLLSCRRDAIHSPEEAIEPRTRCRRIRGSLFAEAGQASAFADIDRKLWSLRLIRIDLTSLARFGQSSLLSIEARPAPGTS
jgi:hypothetical protein